jgi:Lipocalin-like domain
MKKFTILLLIIALAGCSKDDGGTKVQTKKEMFAKTWKQVDLLAAIGAGVQTSVFTTFLTACQQDNLWNFKPDGTYTVTEGPTRCNASVDVVTTGTWTMTDNDTKVTFVDATNGTQTYTIVELTATALRLNGIQTYQGTPVNVTAVFAAN